MHGPCLDAADWLHPSRCHGTQGKADLTLLTLLLDRAHVRRRWCACGDECLPKFLTPLFADLQAARLDPMHLEADFRALAQRFNMNDGLRERWATLRTVSAPEAWLLLHETVVDMRYLEAVGRFESLAGM